MNSPHSGSQGDATPHQDGDDYPASQPEDSTQWMVEVIQETFVKDVQQSLEERLFPKAAAIQEAVKALQDECAHVAESVSVEKERAATELAGLTDILVRFQQSIQDSLGQLPQNQIADH